jgi:hypothetical protein
MDGTPLGITEWVFSVDGFPKHIENPPEEGFGNRDFHRLTRVFNQRALRQTLGGRQRYTSHYLSTELGLHLNGYLAIITGS